MCGICGFNWNDPALVRRMAAEIAHTRTHAAHLLQAVLKEAFTPAS